MRQLMSLLQYNFVENVAYYMFFLQGLLKFVFGKADIVQNIAKIELPIYLFHFCLIQQSSLNITLYEKQREVGRVVLQQLVQSNLELRYFFIILKHHPAVGVADLVEGVLSGDLPVLQQLIIEWTAQDCQLGLTHEIYHYFAYV